jgi:peptidyl-prolyl cis-trans isomerase SurA
MHIVKTVGIIALFCLTTNLQAQENEGKVIDKIVAIVGDRIVLQSDVNQSINEYLRANPGEDSDTLKCSMIENIMSQHLLCEQAERDSVTVGEEEVEGNLENRLRYFVQQYGSEEKMEEVLGKTMYQLKDDYRKILKDMLLAQRMQSSLITNVKISPAEVRAFYEKIPKDSLPFYPAQLEVGQLVMAPIPGKESEAYAKKQLLEIREEIVSGKSSFETMAGIYSQDPGTKDIGGDLGLVTRDAMVTEFSSAAFRLQNNEISNIVKTEFGYHIIQMVQRQGEKAKLRHILLKPIITSEDINVCKAKIDSVHAEVMAGRLSFNTAVGKFSADKASKSTGGIITNQNSGSSQLSTDELEPGVAMAVADMKPGTYSSTSVYKDLATGDDLCRFIYLKNISEPHIANMKEDYGKIMQVALAEKQNRYLSTWVSSHLDKFYIKLEPEFAACENLKKWGK